MSARKKWKLRVFTGGGFQDHRPASRADAYRRVDRYRTDVELGISRVTRVKVYVDDGDGWGLYEEVELA